MKRQKRIWSKCHATAVKTTAVMENCDKLRGSERGRGRVIEMEMELSMSGSGSGSEKEK